MSAQVAADLRAAADVLERDGWTRESYGTFTGCKCLIGALVYAITDGNAITDAQITGADVQRLDDAAWWLAGSVDAEGRSTVAVIDWNDYVCRDAAEVIAALRAAADRAEAEQ